MKNVKYILMALLCCTLTLGVTADVQAQTTKKKKTTTTKSSKK